MLKLSAWLGSAALLCGFGMFPSSASAAPIGNVSELQTRDSSNIEKVHSGRRCWRHHGHWHCRRGYAAYYDEGYPYYGGYYPSYGYGPSIGLSFGGGRHWGGGHHSGGHGRR
jgi:hypothetical protein